jgi:hypothetical protein
MHRLAWITAAVSGIVLSAYALLMTRYCKYGHYDFDFFCNAADGFDDAHLGLPSISTPRDGYPPLLLAQMLIPLTWIGSIERAWTAWLALNIGVSINVCALRRAFTDIAFRAA